MTHEQTQVGRGDEQLQREGGKGGRERGRVTG